ncbi:hypothetical protein CC2G_002905 [Coprinopsis cinerea AmutBmut pab1-1]|nr:hypothetical protein CC2G_002905 [Coprinopsis cinerea AmutBmut pab1-1]
MDIDHELHTLLSPGTMPQGHPESSGQHSSDPGLPKPFKTTTSSYPALNRKRSFNDENEAESSSAEESSDADIEGGRIFKDHVIDGLKRRKIGHWPGVQQERREQKVDSPGSVPNVANGEGGEDITIDMTIEDEEVFIAEKDTPIQEGQAPNLSQSTSDAVQPKRAASVAHSPPSVSPSHEPCSADGGSMMVVNEHNTDSKLDDDESPGSHPGFQTVKSASDGSTSQAGAAITPSALSTSLASHPGSQPSDGYQDRSPAPSRYSNDAIIRGFQQTIERMPTSFPELDSDTSILPDVGNNAISSTTHDHAQPSAHACRIRSSLHSAIPPVSPSIIDVDPSTAPPAFTPSSGRLDAGNNNVSVDARQSIARLTDYDAPNPLQTVGSSRVNEAEDDTMSVGSRRSMASISDPVDSETGPFDEVRASASPPVAEATQAPTPEYSPFEGNEPTISFLAAEPDGIEEETMSIASRRSMASISHREESPKPFDGVRTSTSPQAAPLETHTPTSEDGPFVETELPISTSSAARPDVAEEGTMEEDTMSIASRRSMASISHREESPKPFDGVRTSTSPQAAPLETHTPTSEDGPFVETELLISTSSAARPDVAEEDTMSIASRRSMASISHREESPKPFDGVRTSTSPQATPLETHTPTSEDGPFVETELPISTSSAARPDVAEEGTMVEDTMSIASRRSMASISDREESPKPFDGVRTSTSPQAAPLETHTPTSEDGPFVETELPISTSSAARPDVAEEGTMVEDTMSIASRRSMASISDREESPKPFDGVRTSTSPQATPLETHTPTSEDGPFVETELPISTSSAARPDVAEEDTMEEDTMSIASRRSMASISHREESPKPFDGVHTSTSPQAAPLETHTPTSEDTMSIASRRSMASISDREESSKAFDGTRGSMFPPPVTNQSEKELMSVGSIRSIASVPDYGEDPKPQENVKPSVFSLLVKPHESYPTTISSGTRRSMANSRGQNEVPGPLEGVSTLSSSGGPEVTEAGDDAMSVSRAGSIASILDHDEDPKPFEGVTALLPSSCPNVTESDTEAMPRGARRNNVTDPEQLDGPKHFPDVSISNPPSGPKLLESEEERMSVDDTRSVASVSDHGNDPHPFEGIEAVSVSHSPVNVNPSRGLEVHASSQHPGRGRSRGLTSQMALKTSSAPGLGSSHGLGRSHLASSPMAVQENDGSASKSRSTSRSMSISPIGSISSSVDLLSTSFTGGKDENNPRSQGHECGMTCGSDNEADDEDSDSEGSIAISLFADEVCLPDQLDVDVGPFLLIEEDFLPNNRGREYSVSPDPFDEDEDGDEEEYYEGDIASQKPFAKAARFGSQTDFEETPPNRRGDRDERYARLARSNKPLTGAQVASMIETRIKAAPICFAQAKPRRSQSSPPQKVYTPTHYTKERNQFKADIRKHCLELMRRPTPRAKVESVPFESVLAFGESEDKDDGPSVRNFGVFLDFKSLTTVMHRIYANSWNRRAAVVFAQSFVSSGLYDCDDKDAVESQFLVHLIHLGKLFARQGKKNSAAAIKASADARRKSRRDRFEETADFYSNIRGMEHYPELWAKIHWRVLSGDETDPADPDGPRVITHLKWRHRRIRRWMQNWAYLEDHRRHPDNENDQGKDPDPRRDPSQEDPPRKVRERDGHPQKCLPRNFYTKSFLKKVEGGEYLEDYKIQEKENLSFPPSIMGIIKKQAVKRMKRNTHRGSRARKEADESQGQQQVATPQPKVPSNKGAPPPLRERGKAGPRKSQSSSGKGKSTRGA